MKGYDYLKAGRAMERIRPESGSYGRKRGKKMDSGVNGCIFLYMIFLRILLYCAVCCVQAVAGIRLADVATESSPVMDALGTVGDRVRDSASCRKLTEEWNQQADREEKRWKEAYLSGCPTPREWVRMAEFESQEFERVFENQEFERIGNAKEKEDVSLTQLEDDGVISREDADQAFAALRRLLFVSKAAVDSLDDVIARAEFPLPSSPDGDSYEKLLAWKLNPEYSLSGEMERDSLANGSMAEALGYCWNAGVMENLNGVLDRMRSERKGRLVRRHADRKVEEAERLSKLPPLTPEQWCWFIKQTLQQESIECFTDDMLTLFFLWKGVENEPEESSLRAACRYFYQEVPDKVVRVWKEKVRQEEGR